MKVLFLGLGGIGQRHLRVLKEILPNSIISAVRHSSNAIEITDTLELNPEINIEEKYNITTFPSIEKAVIDKPDFAIIANPTSMHVETARKLVEHKIPVLLEKPISNSDGMVDELAELSIKNKTPVMIAYMMRFHPCVVKLEKYINDCILGNIYNISIDVNSYMPSWHKYESYNSFYAGRNDLGGGVILTEIHEIDLLNFFFGIPEKLYAVGGKRSSLDLDVEDSANILMEYKNGDSKFAVTLNMSFVQQTPLRQFNIFGESGSILWNIAENSIKLNDYINSYEEDHSYDNFQRNDLFRDQMLHFIESIKNKRVPLTDISRVLGSHKIAMSIKKALKI